MQQIIFYSTNQFAIDKYKNKNKNNLPLATVLTILLYYRIDAESEVAIRWSTYLLRLAFAD